MSEDATERTPLLSARESFTSTSDLNTIKEIPQNTQAGYVADVEPIETREPTLPLEQEVQAVHVVEEVRTETGERVLYRVDCWRWNMLFALSAVNCCCMFNWLPFTTVADLSTAFFQVSHFHILLSHPRVHS